MSDDLLGDETRPSNEELARQFDSWADRPGDDRPSRTVPASALRFAAERLRSDAAAVARVAELEAERDWLNGAVAHAVKMMRDARSGLDQFGDRIDEFVFGELACSLDDEPVDINGDLFAAAAPSTPAPETQR